MPKTKLALALLSLLFTSDCYRRTRLPIQTGPPAMLVLGDSLSEGVQSADANRETQAAGYASLIARQMRGSFPLPLIQIRPVGVVGSTLLVFRHRIHPKVLGADLAVSGATLADTLTAPSQSGVKDEYELVLSPRSNISQLTAAQANPAPLILFWAGSNDVISAVLTFDRLDASQMTPPDQFRTEYTQAITQLKAIGRPVVVANIPDVTQIAFLMDRETLREFAGSDFGLPPGSLTTVVTALLLRLGLESDIHILQNPRLRARPEGNFQDSKRGAAVERHYFRSGKDRSLSGR